MEVGELKKRISQYFDEHVAGISVKEEWAEGYNFDIANIIDEAKKDLGNALCAKEDAIQKTYDAFLKWFGDTK